MSSQSKNDLAVSRALDFLHLFISNIVFSKEILSAKCTLSELNFCIFTLIYHATSLSQPAESLDLGLLPQLSVHICFVSKSLA